MRVLWTETVFFFQYLEKKSDKARLVFLLSVGLALPDLKKRPARNAARASTARCSLGSVGILVPSLRLGRDATALCGSCAHFNRGSSLKLWFALIAQGMKTAVEGMRSVSSAAA